MGEWRLGGLIRDISSFDAVRTVEIEHDEGLATFRYGVRALFAVVFAETAKFTEEQLQAVAELIYKSERVSFIQFDRALVSRDVLRSVRYPAMVVSQEWDWIVNLPESLAQYRGHLKSSLVKKVDYELRRLDREFGPRMAIEVIERNDVVPAVVNAIRVVWETRLAEKHQDIPLDADEYWTGLASAVQEFGLVLVVRIDGAIAAASVVLIDGSNATLDILTHSPEHARFGVGRVALMQTVEELIGRGVRVFHLLWGNQAYKADFGALPNCAFTFVLARSRIAWLKLGHAPRLIASAYVTGVKTLLRPAIRFLLSHITGLRLGQKKLG